LIYGGGVVSHNFPNFAEGIDFVRSDISFFIDIETLIHYAKDC
jgi:hypothetical protein